MHTKVRNLLALGTSKRQAILTALSSKSYWHLSRTLATQTGMTNDWLARQDLLSERDLWMKAHEIFVRSLLLNRLVRTRMLGGVGTGG